MTALHCRDKAPGQKCCSDMKGKFKRQHQVLRHLWKSFLFCQSFRARRWVHAQLAQSLLTRAGQLAGGTAYMPAAPHCCRQPAEFTAETHPKTGFLLQIACRNWARASTTSASRRWGCPSSQYHPAWWDTYLTHSHSSCSAENLESHYSLGWKRPLSFLHCAGRNLIMAYQIRFWSFKPTPSTLQWQLNNLSINGRWKPRLWKGYFKPSRNSLAAPHI